MADASPSSDSPAPDRDPIPIRLWVNAPRGLGYVFAAGTAFFVAYAVLSLVNSGYGTVRIGIGLLGFALLLVLVRPSLRRPASDQMRRSGLAVALVAGITVVATVFAASDPARGGGFGMFFAAGIGAAFLRPDRRALMAIAAVSIDTLIVVSVNWRDLEAAFPIAVEVGLISLVVYGVGRLRTTNTELYQARHDMARLAVTEERLRIARDLHDTLGQSLTLIALKAELVERLIPSDPARAQAEAADVRQAAREALTSVRETVRGYRQPELNSEIEGVRAALAVAGIDARVAAAPSLPLPPPVDAVLAWAVREAGTNVLRHSGARHAAIAVGSEGDVAFAEISDDGPAQPPAPFGSGLSGLAERVASRGGSLEAGPRPEGGYRLRVTIPLAAPLPAQSGQSGQSA